MSHETYRHPRSALHWRSRQHAERMGELTTAELQAMAWRQPAFIRAQRNAQTVENIRKELENGQKRMVA